MQITKLRKYENTKSVLMVPFRVFVLSWFRDLHFGLVFLFLLASPAWADDKQSETRAAWLKEHAAALKSIDPGEVDFADLDGFGKAIGDSRIVMLGEQTHGDGATLHAKTRMIKYLHEKKGFDVLAFESGLYDCRKAWELLREGKLKPYEAVSHGVFGIWTRSEQVQPLIEYLGEQVKGKNPLELAGFDCQFTAAASAKFLPGELAVFLGKVDAISAEQRSAVVAGCKRLAATSSGPLDEAQAAEFVAAFAAARKALDGLKPTETIKASELAFWQQFLASAAVFCEAQTFLQKKDMPSQQKYGTARDGQMAKNLIWLANNLYPKRKIIVWAASFHTQRNQAQVEALDKGPLAGKEGQKTVPIYKDTVTMGHDTWKALGKEIYSVAFIAAEGEWHLPWWNEGRKLAPPMSGSLEEAFVKAGFDNAFLNLRDLPDDGKWLKSRLVARPMGHGEMEAHWTQVFDAFVFTRKMFGSKRIPAPDMK